MFKKVKNFELRGRICAIVATERLERLDILCGQNTKRFTKVFVFQNNQQNIEVMQMESITTLYCIKCHLKMQEVFVESDSPKEI